MSEQLDRFISLLKGIFELDKSDLDFGIYRIMNIRKKEIEKFLAEGLPARVKDALAPFAGNTSDIEKRIAEIEKQRDTVGIEVANSKMAGEYNELKATLAKGVDLSGLEADVYSQLYSFFNRYYEEGDFISKRRYKEGVYAIPYEGEEVKLYWANQDQYYIKTSENFKDYTFVADGYNIHFRLVDATTEQNNNKESKDNKRVFMLYTEDPERPELKTFEFDAEKKELIIRFVFDIPEDKKVKYEELNDKAITTWLIGNCQELVTVLLVNISSDPKKQQNLLQKHLRSYVAKNTFDYFIHKDLKKFLSRELDFFIKNEVMHLDDVDTTDEKRVDTWLAKVRAIKRVGHVIIDFLASIEDFQKKLWLKKKFVVQCDYCITLDRIPERFYKEIWSNEAQLREWQSLGFISDLNWDYKNVNFKFNNEWHEVRLKESSVEIVKLPAAQSNSTNTPLPLPANESFAYLLVDTKFFNQSFKEQLLACIDNFDEQCNGLILNSDNFHALNFLQKSFAEKIQCIYIDPPYNTGSDGFIYKDNFKHSSWLCMMENRLALTKRIQENESALYASINEEERNNLDNLLGYVYSPEMYLANFVVKVRHENRILKGDKDFHETYENLIAYKCSENHKPNKRIEDNSSLDEYYWYIQLNGQPCDTINLGGKKVEIYAPESFSFESGNGAGNGLKRISVRGSIREGNSSGRFYVAHLENIGEQYAGHLFKVDGIGKDELGFRYFWTPDAKSKRKNGDYFQGVPCDKKDSKDVPYPDLWDFEKEFNLCSDEGGIIFRNGKKPLAFLKHIFKISNTCKKHKALVLDYFAGSGTTGHAVIEQNRHDGGDRKYILVEMGTHFLTATKPRIEKVVFSADWKDGKPQAANLEPKKKKFDKTLGLDLGKDSLGFALVEDGELTDSGVVQYSNPYNGISHCFKYMRLESYEDALSNVELPEDKSVERMVSLFGDEYLIKYMLDLDTAGSVLNLAAFNDPFDYKLKVTEKNETKEVNADLMETFNYLIGLTVNKMYARKIFSASPDPAGEYEGAVKLTGNDNGEYIFRQIEGTLPSGERALIIWRNITNNLLESNAALDAYFQRYRINPADREYDVIYVNGDNNIANLKSTEETWKVRMIEPEFKARMFEEK